MGRCTATRPGDAVMPAPLPIRTDRDPAELRRLARRERDGRVSARLLALANALDGMPREEAARLAGMTGQTLGDWVHRYNEEGVEGLRDRPRPGRPCALDEGQPGGAQGAGPQGPEARAGRLRRLARPRPVRAGRAPLRRRATARPGCCGCSGASTSPGRRRGRSTPRPTRGRRSASKKPARG